MEECTIIYVSKELREATARSLREHHQTASSGTDFAICTHRLAHEHQPPRKCLGVQRSVGSTDLLYHAVTYSPLAHSSASLDSLEGALSLPSVSNVEHRMEHQPPSATEICLQGSKIGLGSIVLPAGGEGKSSEGTIAYAEEDEKWEDARESVAQMGEEVSDSTYDDEEAEPEEKNDTGTRAPADSAVSMEKEWRGVERERESVMWKMEMIHRSVQTVQEILRALLTHLVEAQSFNANNTGTSQHAHLTTLTPNADVHFKSAHTLSRISSHLTITQAQGRTHFHSQPHPHCRAAHAVARRPSEMCLTHPTQPLPETCCPGMFEPPSCAQHMKERMETFHILTELREDLGQVRMAQEEDVKEQREILALLHGFQQQIGSLLDQHPSTSRLDHQQTSKIKK
ncbi:hypothetical protein NFI96_011401, partial [Prochilodus magdalenae]